MSNRYFLSSGGQGSLLIVTLFFPPCNEFIYLLYNVWDFASDPMLAFNQGGVCHAFHSGNIVRLH